VQEDKGGICSHPGGEEKGINRFNWKTYKGRDHFGDLEVNEKTILLKWILNK
jgi:hypothetical protein